MSEQEDPTEVLATPPDTRDVSAELAAPPRPRLPWPTLALAGAVIAAASFGGGVWYEKGNGSGSRPAAASGRQGGGFGQGGYGGGQGGFRRGGQGGGQGGMTRGTVKNVDGTTVYLTDANGNTVKVTTTDSTRVMLSTQGKVSDLQPGQSVVVTGTPDSSGGYAATQLTEGAGLPGGLRQPGNGTANGTGNGTGAVGG